MPNVKSHEMSSAIRNDTSSNRTSSNQYDHHGHQTQTGGYPNSSSGFTSAGVSNSLSNSNKPTREFDHFGRRISYDNQLDDEDLYMTRSEKESALNNAKPYYDPIDRKENSANSINSMNLSRTSDRTNENERPEQRSSTSGGFKRTTSYDNFNDFRGPQRKTQNEPVKKGLGPYSNPKPKPRTDQTRDSRSNLTKNSEVIVTHSPNNNQEGLTSVFARCLFCGKNSVPEKFKGNLDRR